MPMDLNKKLAIRKEFDSYVNMTPDEMRTHFATTEADMVSLDPKVAAKLGKVSGRTLGKKALVLKEKEQWEESDFDEAMRLIRPLRFQLGRKVALVTEQGQPTPFCLALMNRGHDPRRVTQAVPVAEAELALSDVQNGIEDAIRRFVRLVVGANENDYDGPYPWVKRVFLQSGRAIVEVGKDLFAVGFGFTGDPFDSDSEIMILPHFEEVVEEYVPARSREAEPPEITGEVLSVGEAQDEAKGPVWRIVIIRAGDAKNKAENGIARHYPADVLKTTVAEGGFDNLPGYVRTDKQHVKREGTTLAGMTGKAEWNEVEQCVEADFTWERDRYPALIHEAVKKAVAEGRTEGVPGFSITADLYTYKFAPHIVAKIEKVHSCDPISFASAGGAVKEIVSESQSHTTTEKVTMTDKQKQELLAALEGAKILNADDLRSALSRTSVSEGVAVEYMIATLKEKAPELFDGEDNMEAQLSKNEALAVKLFKMHMKAATGDSGPSLGTEDPQKTTASEAITELDELLLDTAVDRSGLDDIQKNSIRKRFSGQRFVRATVEEAIREAKDIQAAYEKTDPARVRIIRPSEDKLQVAFNDFFMMDVPSPTERKQIAESYNATISSHQRGTVYSIKQLAEMVVGRPINWLSRVEVAEAMDAVVAAKVLVNGMNLRVAHQFNMPGEYQDWRNITNVVPVPDYKPKTALVFGSITGWGPRDDEDGYPVLNSQGATAEQYTPDDQGGIFTITKKHFINDDVGFFQNIPQQIADVALFSVSKLIWVGMIMNNPTLSDSKAAFDETRGNLVSGVLDESGEAVRNAIRAMQRMTFPGDNERKLITRPRYLAVSIDPSQQEIAYNMTTSASGQSNSVASWLQTRGLVPITNPHTDDYNDFYLFANRGVIELGVFGGQVDPVVTIADNPSEGRRFTHDEIRVKGDHAYGGNWISPLNAVKSENVGE